MAYNLFSHTKGLKKWERLFRSRKPPKFLFTVLIIWFFLWISDFLGWVYACTTTGSAITGCRHDLMEIIVWIIFATIGSFYLFCFLIKIISISRTMFGIWDGLYFVARKPKFKLKNRKTKSCILIIEFSLFEIFIFIEFI